MRGLGGALARAAAHAAGAMACVLGVWAVARLFGAPDALGAALGVAAALAPGAYDYLGRDLLGRSLGAEPLAEDATFRTPQGTLRRAPDEVLAASDFVAVSRMVEPALADAVAALTPEAWLSLPPGDPVEAAVIGALDERLDAVPDWAVDGRLPLEALYLADLRGRLGGLAGRDAPDAAPAPSGTRPARLN